MNANAKINAEIKPLFAEPVMIADLSGVLSQSDIQYIQSIKLVQNRTNYISEDLYIFDHPQLKHLKKAVQGALDQYASEVLGITQKLYPTQSWTLMNPPGAGMHGHSHSNSIISGSFYYAPLIEPVASMIFSRSNSYQQIELPPTDDRRSIFNTPMHQVKPQTGQLILFSSALQHLVEPNMGTQPRHSIAFNTFIKGKIGDYRDVSELKL